LSICAAKHFPVAVAQYWCMFKLSTVSVSVRFDLYKR